MKPAPRVTLGGNFHPDFKPEDHFWNELGYIWVDLGGGETLTIFVNRQKRLLVADMSSQGHDFGNEFVRTTMPRINVAQYRRQFAKVMANDEEQP